MPFLTTSGGLNFSYPTDGTTNYGQTMAATWAAISAHDHSGGGKGVQISVAGLAANSINDTIIRLRNGQYLRSLNNAGSGDVNVIGVNSSDQIQLGTTTVIPAELQLTGSATPLYMRNSYVGGYANAAWRTLDRYAKTTSAAWTTVETFSVAANQALVVRVLSVHRDAATGNAYSILNSGIGSQVSDYSFGRAGGNILSSPYVNNVLVGSYSGGTSSALFRFNVNATTVDLQVSSGAAATMYHAVQYSWCWLSTDA